MPNRSEYDAFSMHREEILSTCVLVGAGAANLTIPTVPPAGDNFASTGARSAVGVYAIVCKELFPLILQVIPTIVSTDGVPKHAVVTSVVESTKTINVKVWSLAPTFQTGNVVSSDPASINGGATGTATLAIVGAAVGDTVFVHPRALATGLVVQSYSVTAPDVVTVTLFNTTGAPVDDGVQTYEYTLLKDTAADLATTDTLKLTVRARKNS